MKPLVLIIDSDLVFRESLRDDLLQAGFYAFIASPGNEVASTLHRLKPDVLLISADLPEGVAYVQVGRLRQDPQAGNLPIIMYSASTQLPDKARCLDVGADDFVGRPFPLDEIVARIHGLLRHIDGAEQSDIVQVGGLRVDMPGYSVSYENRSIELSRTMFKVLCLLVRQPDRVFTRERIRNAVWGESAGISERSVDVFMNRLRQNMGGDARNMVRTVRGVGYKLSANKPVCGAIPLNNVYRYENGGAHQIPVADNLAHAL